MSELPLAPIERLIRNSGASRVSIDGAKALRDVLEEIGTEIATRAVKMAKHAGRKTVQAEDIKIAR